MHDNSTLNSAHKGFKKIPLHSTGQSVNVRVVSSWRSASNTCHELCFTYMLDIRPSSKKMFFMNRTLDGLIDN